MLKSAMIVSICLTGLTLILQCEKGSCSPVIKSASAMNLINHMESQTRIEFPFKTTDNCLQSPCFSANTNIVNFVCGSDGQNYRNYAELECLQKSCHPDLKIKTFGKCRVPNANGKDKSLFREEKLYLPNPVVSQAPFCNPDECGCGDEFAPICGSDGVTYGNACLLNCNRKCSPDVTLFHDGYCGRIFFRDSAGKTFQVSPKRLNSIKYSSIR